MLYGGAAWCGGVLLLPLVLLWPGDDRVREQRLRRIASFSYRCLFGLIRLFRVGYVSVEGRQWLRDVRGKLILANHPMYLDALALGVLMPQADCVIKQSMHDSRWYRRFARAIGYIGNGGGAQVMEDCVAALRAGRHLILFPEGTRSTPGEPLSFQRGAAQVAVRSGCDIVPVVIRCEPLGLGKGQRWHDTADQPWHLHLKVLPPRSLASFGHDPQLPPSVAARQLTRELQAFFTTELAAATAAGNAAHAEALRKTMPGDAIRE